MGNYPIRVESGKNPLRNAKQERYCLARMAGMKRKEAYFHAGWTSSDTSMPARQERIPAVKNRLLHLRSQVATQAVISAAVTRNEVTENLRHVFKLALRGTPILDKEGNPSSAVIDHETGEVETLSKPDLSAANRSLEIQAKMNGFLLDVARKETLDEELDGKSTDELQAFLRSLMEQLDPNMRKKFLAEMEENPSLPEGETLQ